jgi:hypothetical protein
MKKTILLILLQVILGTLVFSQVDSTAYVEEETPEEATDETYADDESETPIQLVAPEKLPSTQRYQAEKISVKKFDDKKWKTVVGTTDYNEAPPNKRKEDSKKTTPSFSMPWNSGILKPIAYLFIIGIVAWILFYIVKNISSDLKLRKTRVEKSDVEAPLENIEEVDLLSLLAQARAEKDFRFAIRLYYLSLLKKLNEEGIIRWKKDKTNRDYLSELFLRQYYFEEMSRLTVSYEQVWYGERLLTETTFQKLVAGFETVYQKINTASAS